MRRDERGFFVASAAVVTVIAQVTDPGTALDLLIVSPAVVAFIFQDRLARFPAEVFAGSSIVPIFVVVGVQGGPRTDAVPQRDDGPVRVGASRVDDPGGVDRRRRRRVALGDR